jgi:hypothetical protein
MTATTRPPLVARMLLRSGLICLVSVMSACVLPIAPEFQDPPAEANFSPVIVDTMPELGLTVTGTPDGLTTFNVTVTDQNPGDTLHVRWIVDYPPFTVANTRVVQEDFPISPSPSGMPQQTTVPQKIGCHESTLSALSPHTVMAIVADRPFQPSLPPPAPVDLGRLPTDGLKTVAVWILDLECP